MTHTSRLNADELYALVPAVHRQRDAARGEPLRALLAVLAEQGALVEDDIAALYENWFIETCDEWVVPYVAGQVAVRGLREIGEGVPFSRRALVANTIGYRRRKGTASVLEQLAFDTTGWRAVAVEFFQRLGWTQHVNHVRPGAGGTAHLRPADAAAHAGGPFDAHARTADVRSIAAGRGRHNVSHLGLFLWRLQAYRVLRGELRPSAEPGGWHVHPLGVDAPLFNPPQADSGIEELAGERHVPAPLRRRPLYDELEARRQALADGSETVYRYFDDRPEALTEEAFVLELDGEPVPPERLCVCDLSTWTQPPDQRSYTHVQSDGSSVVVDLPIAAAVDPVLGRVSLAPATAAASVRLSHSYGFSADLGGGPYDRRLSVDAALDREVSWQIGVSREHDPVPGEVVATLAEAVAAWNAQPPGSVGLIALMDSGQYTEDLTGADRLVVPEGSLLVLAAGDWPSVPVPGGLPGELARTVGRIEASLRRPHLQGDVEVLGSAAPDSETPGELVLDGLLVEGNLTVADGNLGRLRLAHCTLAPPTSGLAVAAGNEALELELARCITGALSVPGPIDRIAITGSILQAANALDAPASPVSLDEVTVLGDALVLAVEASNSIVTGALVAERRQQGCVRYSYLGAGSEAPRRYRCQPDLALREAPPGEHDAIRARLAPSFTSVDPGQPAYGQLGRTCAGELKAGADDGAEMGAFHLLQEAHRLSNHAGQLQSYLRFGLEAGVELVT